MESYTSHSICMSTERPQWFIATRQLIPLCVLPKTYSDNDHSLTSPSPPPVAKFSPSSLIPTVADGCHAAPPTLSVCPLFVETAFKLGKSHILESPVHDVVRIYWEFGEKRNVDSGRSSPNCDPRLLNDWKVSSTALLAHVAYLHFLIQRFPGVDNFPQR